LDPNNHILPANCAQCCLNLKKYDKAISYSNAALSIDPTYVKALLRRAAAYSALGKHEQAIEGTDYLLMSDIILAVVT